MPASEGLRGSSQSRACEFTPASADVCTGAESAEKPRVTKRRRLGGDTRLLPDQLAQRFDGDATELPIRTLGSSPDAISA